MDTNGQNVRNASLGIRGVREYHVGKEDATPQQNNPMNRNYNDDPPIHLTALGQIRLQEIVKQAREGLTYSAFCAVTGLSAPLVQKLETAQQKDFVRLSTLQKLALAPKCGLTVDELIMLCKIGDSLPIDANITVASDLFPVLDRMPDSEVARLIAYAAQRFILPSKETSFG